MGSANTRGFRETTKKLMSLGIAISRGGGVNTLYFVYDGTHIRNLFLLRVVNNMAQTTEWM